MQGQRRHTSVHNGLREYLLQEGHCCPPRAVQAVHHLYKDGVSAM
jgi:hypothetical protein